MSLLTGADARKDKTFRASWGKLFEFVQDVYETCNCLAFFVFSSFLIPPGARILDN